MAFSMKNPFRRCCSPRSRVGSLSLRLWSMSDSICFKAPMPWLLIYKLSSIRSRERIMLGTAIQVRGHPECKKQEVNLGSGPGCRNCDFERDFKRLRYFITNSSGQLPLVFSLCSLSVRSSRRLEGGLTTRCLLFLNHASRSVRHCSHFCIARKADGQPTISKPKNARSKRALEAREPKEVEDPRTVIFVRGTHTGEVVNGVMKDLVGGPLPAMILLH